MLEIVDKPSKLPPPDTFIVVSRTRAVVDGGLDGCSLLPFGSMFPAIYSQVFGPASREACEQFVLGHCGNAKEKLPLATSDPGETMTLLNERIESCLDQALLALTPREQVEAVEQCLLDIRKVALEGAGDETASYEHKGNEDRGAEFQTRMKGTVDTIKDLIGAGGIPVNIPNVGTVAIRVQPLFPPGIGGGFGGGGIPKIVGAKIVITFPF